MKSKTTDTMVIDDERIMSIVKLNLTESGSSQKKIEGKCNEFCEIPDWLLIVDICAYYGLSGRLTESREDRFEMLNNRPPAV